MGDLLKVEKLETKISKTTSHITQALMDGNLKDHVVAKAMEQHNYTLEILTQEAMAKRREQLANVDEQIALRIKTLNSLQTSYEALVNRKIHFSCKTNCCDEILKRLMSRPSLMTSAQKRQANRRNARRSTGPKTQEGRVVSSLNAVKHGLNLTVDLTANGVNLKVLCELLSSDGLDGEQSKELVAKLMDYERNQAHQLTISKKWQEPEVELTPEVVDEKARQRYPEIDMLDEMIKDELFFNGKVLARDVKKVARIKEAMYRDWIKLHNRQQRAVVREAKNAVRHYKRSSNQLIKTLKALEIG